MKGNFKFLIIIVTFVIISVIITTVCIRKNKKVIICIDPRSWRK